MNSNIILICFLSCLLFVVGCKSDAEILPPQKKTKTTSAPQFKKEGQLTFLKADGTIIATIDLEVASSEAEKQQGLMYRPWMEENQGMLFIFNQEQPQAFWMRNTIIPLDILYVNAAKQIVSIAKDTEPYSEKSIPSGKPAQYVVEVIAGFTAKYNISAGDQVDWVL